MKAIILAAGKGTRLRPLTNDIPKAMIKVLNKTLIERQIENLQNCGIMDITIVTGYKDELFKFPKIDYIKNERFETTNMNESLFCAAEKLNDHVVVCYSDIIFERKIIKQIIESKQDIGLAVNLDWKKNYEGRTLHPFSEAENVVIENERIVKIRKNIPNCESNQKIGEFMGIMILSEYGSRVLLEKYKIIKNIHVGKFHNSSSLQNAYLTDMIQELIDLKIEVKSIFPKGKWSEIDTPEDLRRVEKLFSNE